MVQGTTFTQVGWSYDWLLWFGHGLYDYPGKYVNEL